MDPQSKVDYSLIAPEASMAMKKTSVGDSPLRQGGGKSFWTLPISGDDGGGSRCVSGKLIGYLGFSRRRRQKWTEAVTHIGGTARA
jgi:hypothetical protein